MAELYRLAAASRGVFVNPALTEPFGLTLIEAAACGLPIVATEDGGPTDIIQQLPERPSDQSARQGGDGGHTAADPDGQNGMAAFGQNGIEGVRRHYSWPAHVESYLAVIRRWWKKPNRSPE